MNLIIIYNLVYIIGRKRKKHDSLVSIFESIEQSILSKNKLE